MKAGKLRHRIEIQQESTKRGEFTSTETWTTFYTCSASVDPVRGDERNAAPLIDAKVSHNITMRYAPSITPQNRVKFGNRFFNIKAVINVGERNVELNVFCEEVL